MKNRSLFMTALAVLCLASAPLSSTHAAVIGSFDPNATIIAVGGSGNPNTGWSASSDQGALVALRAHERYQVYSGSTSSPVFTFDTGLEVSIDFTFAATENTPDADNLSDFSFALYYDSDPTATVNWQLVTPGVTLPGPSGFGNDNSYGQYGVTPNGAGNEGPGFLPAASIGANSQLSQWMGGPAFLVDAQSGFALQATKNSTGAVVARTEIAVNAVTPVPEPSGSLLAGLSVFGLLARRKRTAK